MMAQIADSVFDNFENEYWTLHNEDKEKQVLRIELSKLLL